MSSGVRVRHPDPYDGVVFGDLRDDVFTDIRSQWEHIFRQVGWTIMSAERCLNGFTMISVAYTVGLSESADHPELIVVGFDNVWGAMGRGRKSLTPAQQLLHTLGSRIIEENQTLNAGDVVSLWEPGMEPNRWTNLQQVLIGTVDPSRYDPCLLHALVRYERGSWSALQVIFPNGVGMYHAPGYDDLVEPLLDHPVPDSDISLRAIADLAKESAQEMIEADVLDAVSQWAREASD